MELCKENDPRKQSRYRNWNPDWGSSDEVPRGWESVGDNGTNGDCDGVDAGYHRNCQKSFSIIPISRLNLVSNFPQIHFVDMAV